MATTTTTYQTDTRTTTSGVRNNSALYWGIGIVLAIILVAFLTLRDRGVDSQVAPVAPTTPSATDTAVPPSTNTDVNGAGGAQMESAPATDSAPIDQGVGTGTATDVDKSETGTSNSTGTVNQ